MPGMRCAVAICTNSYYKTKGRSDTVTYFRIPQKNNIRSIWIDKCKRKDSWNPDSSYVCSDHFKPEDFERNLKAEIMGLKNVKKILKPGAIPSVKLLPLESKIECTSDRETRKQIREDKLTVSTKLSNTNDSGYFKERLTNDQVQEVALPDIDYKNEYLQLKAVFEKEKDAYEKKISSLQTENERLTLEKNTSVYDEMEKILKGTFSNTQINVLLNNKKKKVKVWSNEDITKAFTIRYLSKRCYIYLRSELKIPLPCLSTLKNWASKIHLRSGILEGVLSLMKVAAQNMTSLEKIVVLQYDEMKVKSLYEYDPVTDRVLGPHSQMQVVMARALFSSWKQPIFVDFDYSMTKSIIEELITKLHGIGYIVRAIVSDCGGGNVGMWKAFNVSHEKCWFFSNTTQRKIYFLADIPHLLKLIRNWYIDGGFTLSDGTLISPKPLEQLIFEVKEVEISSCYKLSPKHIKCEKFERQNVPLAAQLMSHTTACALRRYDVGEEKMRLAATDFIQQTNDWFDVMNSRIPTTSINLKCGYGLKIEEQRYVLEKYIETIANMKCINKKKIQLFQKGILISTRSVIEMYDDLKLNDGIKYILAAKLNQDSLENLFSMIRGGGGMNDHPSPLASLYRLRMIVLGKNTGKVRSNMNTEITNDDFIIGKVLRECHVPCKTKTDVKVPCDLEESDSDSEGQVTETDDVLKKDVSEDGLNYIAGWMAKKLKKKYPEIGTYSDKTTKTWVDDLSIGGLTKPAEDFNENISNLETEFQKYCKESIPKCAGVKRKLVTRM